MKQVLLWLRIIRPGTLSASIAPVSCGLCAASASVRLDALTAAATMLSAVAIQVLANLINDLVDFRAGRDAAGRLGPRRALAEGDVSQSGMENAVIVSFLFAVVPGAFLIWKGGAVILAIGVCALLFAWLYSATRFSLADLGIADLAVFAFFGPVSSVGSAFLQTGSFVRGAFWPGVVCGLISMAVLTVNNIRDRESDRAAGKRTIVVRFGLSFGKIEYLALFALCVPPILMTDAKLCIAAPAAGMILSFFVFRAHGRQFNRLLVLTGLVNILYAVLYISVKR